MKRMILLLTLSVYAAAMQGCAIGRVVKMARTDTEKCDSLVTGKTTEAEVKALFGKQDGFRTGESGTRIKEYSRGYVEVVVQYDKNGIVKKVERCKDIRSEQRD